MIFERTSPQDTCSYLKEADFASLSELFLRYSLVAALALLIWYFTEIEYLPIWLVLFYATEAFYYWAACRTPKVVTPTRARIAQTGYFMTATVFISLPMYMTHDPRHLVSIAAIIAQIGLLTYTLYRIHKLYQVALFDTVLMLAFTTNVVFAVSHTFVEMWERVVFAGFCYAVTIYAIMTLWRALHQQLEGAVNAERLREREKMETVARLTGGVAHDFNNILTVVLGNLELYQHAKDNPEKDALIREAFDAANRGAHLISQLLAYSRRAPMAPLTATLHNHVDAAQPLIRRLLPERIPLDIEISRSAGRIAVDRAQFTSAMLNLVANAADAIGDDNGRVLVSGWPLVGAQGRREVVLAVSDSGGGMPNDIAERVLEPYFTTKPVGKGSGLGLPMVKGFAEQSGGRLKVHNRPGEGVTVTLILPEAMPPETAETPPGQTESTPKGPPSVRSRHPMPENADLTT